MDMKRRTFTLNDLDETFWKKVLLVNLVHSSGMGGWGGLWMVTSELQEFFIGFEGFPYGEYHLEEFSPLFKRKEKVTDYKHPYVAEDHGWTYIRNGNIWVRNDFYDTFIKLYEERKKQNSYLHIPNVAAQALNVKELEQFDYEETVKIQEKCNEEWKALKEERECLKLTEEHFQWKALYDNNNKCMRENGEYALIFKEVDGKVVGYRFSILYQKKEISPLHMHLSAEIEAYNLFEKRYDDVQGELYYKDVKEQIFGVCVFAGADQTLNQYEINCPGDFVRSFQTLVEAKNYAIAIANIRNYANKEIIVNDLDNLKRKYKNLLRKYEAVTAFEHYYPEILEIVRQYEYPDESCAGGKYIFNEVKEQLQIDEALLGELWEYIPQILGKRVQEHAKKMLVECREKLKG